MKSGSDTVPPPTAGFKAKVALEASRDVLNGILRPKDAAMVSAKVVRAGLVKLSPAYFNNTSLLLWE